MMLVLVLFRGLDEQQWRPEMFEPLACDAYHVALLCQLRFPVISQAFVTRRLRVETVTELTG